MPGKRDQARLGWVYRADSQVSRAKRMSEMGKQKVLRKAVDYLLEREWSMGNGQCPECCGVPPSWHGHPLHLTANTIGHEYGCKIAAALMECGEKPLMKGEFTGPDYEVYWTSKGFLATKICS